MSDPLDRLLPDAVDDVEPAHRLEEIRGRVPGRTRWYVTGAVAATAAVLAGIVGLGRLAGSTPDGDALVGRRSSPAYATTSGSPRPSQITATPGLGRYTVYYIGYLGDRTVLYVEPYVRGGLFLDSGGAVDLVQQLPTDPDYVTGWGPGSFRASATGAEIHLAGDTRRDRPSGMSEDEARLALQQVAWTHGGPVRFFYGDQPADRVLGVATPGPVTPDPAVLSPVSIDEPGDGDEVAGSLRVDGSSTVSSVSWSLDLDGTQVDSGVVPILGAESPSPRPTPAYDAIGRGRWTVRVRDLLRFAPGTYTFTASVEVDGVTSSDTRDVRIE